MRETKNSFLMLLVLFFISLSFSCQKQVLETYKRPKKPKVKFNFVFDKDFKIRPIKLVLEGEKDKYYKELHPNKLNYSFFEIRPGNYFIGLIFLEDYNGKKYEFNYKTRWEFDGKQLKTEDNEIKISRNHLVEIKLIFLPYFVKYKKGPPFSRYGRMHWYYKQKFIKERKRDYYEIRFHAEIYLEEK